MDVAFNESFKLGGDLQKFTTKFIPTFPWSKYKGEHHLFGHNFTGCHVA